MTATLAEIIEDKKTVETTIRKMLTQLEEKSGCVITGVFLDYQQIIGKPNRTIRDVEIKVELPKR